MEPYIAKNDTHDTQDQQKQEVREESNPSDESSKGENKANDSNKIERVFGVSKECHLRRRHHIVKCGYASINGLSNTSDLTARTLNTRQITRTSRLALNIWI
jgi:hypothetical protein